MVASSQVRINSKAGNQQQALELIPKYTYTRQHINVYVCMCTFVDHSHTQQQNLINRFDSQYIIPSKLSIP